MHILPYKAFIYKTVHMIMTQLVTKTGQII